MQVSSFLETLQHSVDAYSFVFDPGWENQSFSLRLLRRRVDVGRCDSYEKLGRKSLREPEPFSSSAPAGNQFHRRPAPVASPWQPQWVFVETSSHTDEFVGRQVASVTP